MNIILIGCGFLGSLCVQELLRLNLYAKGRIRSLTLIDGGDIEDRNLLSQGFLPIHKGQNKARVMGEIAEMYDQENLEGIADGMDVFVVPNVIDAEWLDDYLSNTEGPIILVDAVDNLQLRQDIWEVGLRYKHPTLHLGATLGGDGVVQWTVDFDHDAFAFSKYAMLDLTEEQIEALKRGTEKLPPCELIRMRGLGLNVGVAAAQSLFAAMGVDVQTNITGKEEVAPNTWYQNFAATTEGHSLTSIFEVQ